MASSRSVPGGSLGSVGRSKVPETRGGRAAVEDVMRQSLYHPRVRLPSLAFVAGLTACGASGCGFSEEPKTPSAAIGEPSPKAVTSAEPLWLSNDRGQAKPPAAVAR